MEAFIFYCLAAVTLVSALAVVTLRNVLHSALFLGLALAGVAGVFGSLGADFLFAAQILIYVSGIAVLLLFAVMLSGRGSELRGRQTNDAWLAGLILCAAVFWGLWRCIRAYRGIEAAAGPEPTTSWLGRLLLGPYAVPFELITLILLAALVGAVLFTRPDREAEKEGEET